MEEYSYTSTHPLGHTGPATGKLFLPNQVENRLQISHGSKNEIIINRLGFHKILKQMTDVLKR
jgi:hypothetical protein